MRTLHELRIVVAVEVSYIGNFTPPNEIHSTRASIPSETAIFFRQHTEQAHFLWASNKVELVLQQSATYACDDCRVGTPVKWIFIFNFAKEEEAQKEAIVL